MSTKEPPYQHAEQLPLQAPLLEDQLIITVGNNEPQKVYCHLYPESLYLAYHHSIPKKESKNTFLNVMLSDGVTLQVLREKSKAKEAVKTAFRLRISKENS